MENLLDAPELIERVNALLKEASLKKRARLDPIERAKQNPESLRAAVNAKCFECSGYSRIDVKKCNHKECAFYGLRPWKK